MKQTVYTIAIAIIAILTASCSSGHDKQEAIRTANDSVAINYAQHQAELLIEAQPDTAEMCRILLETRAKEQKLRSNGYDTSADVMVKTFEQTIAGKDTKLATVLGL